MSFVFCGVAVVLFLVSLLGLFFAFGLAKSVKKSKCAVATLSWDFLGGTKYNNTVWIGVSPSIKKIDELKKNITNAPAIIGTTFANTDWITTDEGKLRT